jgi:hypothetical protein
VGVAAGSKAVSDDCCCPRLADTPMEACRGTSPERKYLTEAEAGIVETAAVSLQER